MPTLGIFAKRPIAGAVKTRLAATIGDEAAARFYEVSLRTLLTRVRDLALRRVIAVAQTVDYCSTTERIGVTREGEAPAEPQRPDSVVPGSRLGRSLALPTFSDQLSQLWFQQFEGFDLWPQPSGDLGQKLSAWFDFACATDDRVLVIGSDSPALPLEFIEQAVQELDTSDCIIGPALDGGYYLLGLKCPHPRLFEGIDWSSPQVLEQTRARAAELRLRVAELPPWNDVDEFADLAVLQSQLQRIGPAAVWEPLRDELNRLLPDTGGQPLSDG